MKLATKGCRKIALFARLVFDEMRFNDVVNNVIDETMRNELMNSSNRKTGFIGWRKLMLRRPRSASKRRFQPKSALHTSAVAVLVLVVFVDFVVLVDCTQ